MMADLEPVETEDVAAETTEDTEEPKSDDAEAGEASGTATDEDQHASDQHKYA